MKRKTKITALALGFAAALGLGLTYEPWLEYRHQKQQREMAEQDLQNARAERAEYLEEKARYSTNAGREELARKRGYRKPGEVLLDTTR
jgi:hypothetical protein